MTGGPTYLKVGATVCAVACAAGIAVAAANALSPTASSPAAVQASTNSVSPNGVAVDSRGNVYIADYAHSVVTKVATSGAQSVVAGVPDHSGSPTAGPATSSHLSRPTAVAVDASGNLFIVDSGTNALVEKVNPSGILSIVAGVPGENGPPTPGPATSSDLSYPSGISVDGSGNVFIADSLNAVVEKVTSSGVLSVIAGKSTIFGPPQQVLSTSPPFLPVTPAAYLPALSSDLYNPSGVAVDASGNVYIADTNNNVVEKVAPSGALSIVAGQPDERGTPDSGVSATDTTLGTPTALALAAGNLYIADPSNNVIEMVNLSTGGLSIVAGTGNQGMPTPGAGSDAATGSDLSDPSGVAVDANGNIYIADFGNSLVEKVTSGGALSILAGDGAPVVAAVSPTSGPPAGGTSVTVIGSGFNAATSVLFGSTPGTGVTVTSAELITVTAPAGSGTVDVTVQTPHGTSRSGTSDLFTYSTSPPTSSTPPPPPTSSTPPPPPPTSSTPPPPPTCSPAPFRDVPAGSLFCAAITYLRSVGVIGGPAGALFHPAAWIDRGDLADWLYRNAHSGQAAPPCVAKPFRDVSVGNQFCGAIAWLASSRIVPGSANAYFAPYAPISRAEVAGWLYGAFHGGANPAKCTSGPFPDVSTRNPFCAAISWLRSSGAATGNALGGFGPFGPATRQAVAAFLYSLDTGHSTKSR